jgi:sugar phosphate isomerase/epimerase
MTALPVGLAPLSLHRPADPVAFVDAAAGAGFRAVGMTVRTPDGDWAPWARPAGLPALVEAVAARGVAICDVGVATLDPEPDLDSARRLADAAAALHAPVLIVCGRDPDEARASQTLADIAALAAERGVRAGLEFMPYSAVPDLAAARRLVAGTGAGIVFDVFQHERAGGTATDLDPDDPPVLVQLADGVRHRTVPLRTEALTDRRPPGLGTFALPAYLARVPADVPVTVETPWGALAPLPLAEQAHVIARATARVLAATAAQGARPPYRRG